MQVQHYDEKERSKEKVSKEKLLVRKPGSVFRCNGVKYRVADNGALEVVSERAKKKAHRKAQERARRVSR